MGQPKTNNEVKIGMFQIRADLSPASFDNKNRTVDIVMSSGYRGQRTDWMSGDSYMEELDVSDAAIRKVRLDGGLPVLTNHSAMPGFAEGNQKKLMNVGVVIPSSVRIQDGKLIGTMKMSRTADVESILQDLEDGIIRSVSLGYRVYKYLDVSTPTDEMKIFRAVDWEPMEVSLVSLPFDPLAQVRNAPSMYSAIVETKTPNEGEEMSKKTRTAEEAPKAAVEEKKEEAAPAAEAPKAEEKVEEQPAEKPAEEAPAEKVEEKPAETAAPSEEQVRSEERVRSSTIVEAVRKVGLTSEFAQKLISSNVTVSEARSAIIDELATRGEKPLSNKTEIQVGEDKIDIQKRGVVNALMHRMNPTKNALNEEGRIFRGMRLHQIAGELMESAGIKTRGLTPTEIAHKALSRDFHTRAGAHGTGDFSSLLADVANKTLRQAYEEAPQTFKPFVRQVTAPDFKNINRVQLGEFASLDKVNEHGNLQYGTIADSKEQYAILSYAKGLKLTKQAIVNDDLDGFGRLAMLMGRAASRLESDLVYSILLNNAAMGDGVALFHSSHKNLGTTGAIGDTTLTEAQKLGRKQTGLSGAVLNLQYKHLIVSPDIEVPALKAIGQIVPNQASVVNPFVGKYNIIVDARLSLGTTSPTSSNQSATIWFMAADPSEIDTIEIAYLEGAAGPSIIEEVDFDTQGLKMAVWHDVGAKAIDYRGLFKNVGA